VVKRKGRRKSGVKGSQADTGLAPDCIYSSTKRFTFTKSFQLHGARRISTLLSSFRDVILLLTIVGEMQAGTRWPLPLPLSLSLSLSISYPALPFPRQRFQSRSRESFRKSLEKAHRAASYTGTSISLRTAPTRLCLFLPLVIYNGFSLFFSKLRKSCQLPKLLATPYHNCVHT